MLDFALKNTEEAKVHLFKDSAVIVPSEHKTEIIVSNMQ